MEGASGKRTRSGSSTLPPKSTEVGKPLPPGLAEDILSMLNEPLFTAPHYTQADLQPRFRVIASLRKFKALAEEVPPPPLPAVPRFLLNLGWGRLIGKLTYGDSEGEVDCSASGFMLAIPPVFTYVKSEDALFILLVGNDFAFYELTKERFYRRFPCIIVSAEGPPDFLLKLKTDLKLPVLALFDCDPKWLKMLCFYGSLLKDIKWLGIRPTDFDKYKMGERLTLPMTKTDIKTAKGLLKNPFVKGNPKWLRELQVIIDCKRKTEIDSLYCFAGGNYLTQVFLPMKLQEQDWI